MNFTSVDAQFIDAFEARRWPLEAWHHRQHVRLAYLYLRTLPFDEAAKRIRDGIMAHNAAHGVPDGPTSGYHETMTIAWLRLVQTIMAEYAQGEGEGEPSSDAFCDAHPELLEKKTLRLFYSKEHFMSALAKKSFVEPDLAPLPRPRTPPA
jgi:hypothetical protein